MSREFDRINELFRRNEGVPFNIAVLFLMENGYNDMAEITDEEIQNVECPKGFDEIFYRNVIKLARQLAQETSPYDLLRFAMTNTFLRLDEFNNIVPREKLEEMVKERIDREVTRRDTADYIIYLCNRYNCDAEDLEKLGINIPDSYWE